MDNNELSVEQDVPTGVVTGISFNILTEEEAEKASVKVIGSASEVTDPALGLPNLTSQCLTCGAKHSRLCDGHVGLIKFPFTLIHPYYVSDVVQVLNKICPGCKSIRQNKSKKNESDSSHQQLKYCKYCDKSVRDIYPPLKFRVSSKDTYGKTAIIAEIKVPRKVIFGLASDYWDFVPDDPQQEAFDTKSTKRVISHAQAYYILKDVDSIFLKGFFAMKNSIFLQSYPLTPNCHRVMEFGQNVAFDERTRAYKKLVDFRGSANDLSACVIDCLKLSKLRPEKQTVFNSGLTEDSAAPKMCGLRYMKEVHIGKRTDFCFRMVCVGDTYLKVDEIGVPRNIAEEMVISEKVNNLNWEKINACCGLRVIDKGETHVRRNSRLVPVRFGDQLHCGDDVYRPLSDGDIILINRPPSIHPHSLIALSVKILPTDSVLSINPLICSPLRGDFDGDSLHGYIPQSLESRVELLELVSLKQQLVNKQSGQSLLSMSHDSLTACHLLVEDGVFLNRFQMQQLLMFGSYHHLDMPSVIRSSQNSCLWTGKQLFSLLLPQDFDYNVSNVHISKGQILAASNFSSCLRETDDSIFRYLIKHCSKEQVLEFLHTSQEVLTEWLLMRGLTVSLSDLYLSSDSYSRENMIDDVLCGLREAERTSHAELLMVHSKEDFLCGVLEEDQCHMVLGSDEMCYEQQQSAALNRASVSGFQRVFRDIQSLIFNYSDINNSFLSMLKAGSKGNLMKFVQHSMCVGSQHSSVPLSFRFPHRLSCIGWNTHKWAESHVRKYIPFAVIENSFLAGLNPLELLVHSVANRDASFGGHADISGTLTRKLMFFMRDLYVGYDGTVRNPYGNQLVQFTYNVKNASTSGKSLLDDAVSGEPVGALAASSISEVAYGALDQPISVLENSPLLNLKKVLECGARKHTGDKSASLFLSGRLRRRTYGFEYGALQVKNHLEKLLFQDVVSIVSILFSPQTGKQSRSSSWICHFHLSKDTFSRKQLKVHSIIDALNTSCHSTYVKRSKIAVPKLLITYNECIVDDLEKGNGDNLCITVQLVDYCDDSSEQLAMLQDIVIPFLLRAVIKGSSNVKKVNILWKDEPSMSRVRKGSSGELYLQVFMSDTCDRNSFWKRLMNDCLQIMDMIDWERSHPDDIQDVALSLGIDAARFLFITDLKSAISDTGRTLLPEHLNLTADCLSVTGEFVPLSARGLSHQRKQISVSSPFMQACFSTPADCFIKAAKMGAVDNLQGSVEALAWGNIPSLGTGGKFDIMFPGKECKIDIPKDIYSLLASQVVTEERPVGEKVFVEHKEMSSESPTSPLYTYSLNGKGVIEAMTSLLKKQMSPRYLERLSHDLRHILHKYAVKDQLNLEDKKTAMRALFLHPRVIEKIGIGLREIKVGYHSNYGDSRCFILERVDGTVEDFSYHKCIHHAMKLISPGKAKTYESKWFSGRTM